ncbi:type II toxin-antitoxin system VapC family toxin [Bosea sp. (in: a-proteobacteria)]|uniref:type II toxin-antitoxin system VapC family toxin n=1 Tax=Bosea sp. (in: a-proteobacteria) TaxID=1871050 RepID=UPI002FCC647C
MIIPDTSIWIDHLRRSEERLIELLSGEQVLMHPFVTGEIALGSIARRSAVIEVLESLPQAPVAAHGEAMALIERERLHGLGVGYVDVHLLASARLAGASLWSRDQRLWSAAEKLGLAARFDPG